MFQLYGRKLDFARTAVHYLMFVILGLMMSIPGPTLLDLKHNTNSDSKTISFIYTARSIGFFLGCLSGGVLLDFVRNEEIALIISSLVVALGAFVIPWCRSLIFLLGTFATAGFAVGFSNTGSNAGCLRIWGKKSAPYLQGLHFAYGFGGFVAPLLAAPFLSTQVHHTPSLTDLTLLGDIQNMTSDFLQNTTGAELIITSSATSSIPSITIVYSIIGSLAVLVSGCFIFVSIFASDEKATVEDVAQDNVRNPGGCFTVIAVLLTCLLTGLTSGVEISFAQMLTSYVVNSAHKLSKATGSYMTSVYWGAFMATRFVSILLTCKINVKHLLAFDFILALLSSVILLTVGTWSVHALWVGTGLLGIGVASIFPASLSYVEKYVNINNKIASFFNLVSCLLEMSVPYCISMYLESHSNILFQFMIGATSSCCVIFIILNIVLARKGEKYAKDEDEIKGKDEKSTAV